ncbi:MAG: hypothetical protein QY306_17105 [Anaerolineales bacterium]|nr:MAG: hypothetical protein QY306_17105 [Anaerolineales bacterium]
MKNKPEGADFLPGLNFIIDRIEQRDAFVDVLEQMRSNMPFQHNLFEWYGAPGIGKTTLITLLQSECDKRNIPWALVNFDEEEKNAIDEYLNDPIKLIEKITQDLSKYNFDTEFLSNKIDSYHKEQLPPEGACLAYARMSERERGYSDSNPKWLIRMREVLEETKNVLFNSSKKDKSEQTAPFVLFIDGVDAVHELFTDWIEEFVVKPLVQSRHSVVVWTARNSRKWKRPEIRWDRKSEELRTFNEAEVRLQISKFPRFIGEENLAEQLFKNVYVMTGGHPYAGAVVINEIGAWDELSAEIVKKREQELLAGIYKTVIRNYALKGLSPEQMQALELCSMIRLIDTTTLQYVLQECSSTFSEENSWKRKDFDRLLFELRKTYLLRWGKSGWSIEPSLRYLMRSYYLTSGQELFRKVNEAALKVYQDWLSKYVDNRKLFIIEEIYHYVSLQQLNSSENIAKVINVLTERLMQYPSEVKQDPEVWRITLEQIEGDIEHDSEILRIIGEKDVQELISPLKDLLKKNKLMDEKIG